MPVNQAHGQNERFQLGDYVFYTWKGKNPKQTKFRAVFCSVTAASSQALKGQLRRGISSGRSPGQRQLLLTFGLLRAKRAFNSRHKAPVTLRPRSSQHSSRRGKKHCSFSLPRGAASPALVQRSPSPAPLTLQSPHVVGGQVAAEGVPGAGWDVWPHDAGGGTDCHVVPATITHSPLGKHWDCGSRGSEARVLKLLASGGQGTSQEKDLRPLTFSQPRQRWDPTRFSAALPRQLAPPHDSWDTAQQNPAGYQEGSQALRRPRGLLPTPW